LRRSWHWSLLISEIPKSKGISRGSLRTISKTENWVVETFSRNKRITIISRFHLFISLSRIKLGNSLKFNHRPILQRNKAILNLEVPLPLPANFAIWAPLTQRTNNLQVKQLQHPSHRNHHLHIRHPLPDTTSRT
jgi:hypothetical protein